MVRDNSTVDLGLWKWYDKSNLLIPLDVHVLQESISFGLLKPAGSFAKETDSSQKITSSAKESDSSQNNNTSSKTDISLPACRTSAKETNHSIPSATIKMAKELSILSAKGKAVGEITLDEKVFGVELVVPTVPFPRLTMKKAVEILQDLDFDIEFG